MVTLNNILFLDIETVPQYDSYDKLSDEWKALWDVKAAYLIRNKEEETVQSIYNRAGIYAEFGKVVCITCGIIQGNGPGKKLVIKSFAGDDEKEVLLQFADMLKRWVTEPNKNLCAHNGKEFDFPYLCRRMIIHNIPLPAILNTRGKKPWEVNHLDTMDMWRFGDFKTFTSLNLLACTLGIPTPKDDIDGSMVWEVYWKEKNINRIVTYCQKDVITLVQVYLRLSGEELIYGDNIEIKQ
jgi:Predicted exonuclease